jgi:hypothetical protein
MSITTPLRRGSATDTSGTSRRLGLVARCRSTERGTSLAVVDGAGAGREIELHESIDARAGRELAACFRRLSWARLELTATGPRGSVNGVRHRLPVTVPVPVDAVLGLAQRGVPTLVVTA